MIRIPFTPETPTNLLMRQLALRLEQYQGAPVTPTLMDEHTAFHRHGSMAGIVWRGDGLPPTFPCA